MAISRYLKWTVVWAVGLMLLLLPGLTRAQTVSFWTQSATNPAVLALLEAFTEETGIEVEVRAITFGTEEVFVAMAGGAPPDIFTHGAAALGAFGALGQLYPLDRAISQWDFMHDMVPSVKAAGVYQGVQIAMPWRGATPRDLVYRIDAFEEAGLGEPPVTWDDLVSYGRRLVRFDNDGAMTRSAITLATTSTGGQQVFSMLHNQLGGSILVGEASGLGDPSAAQALDFHVDLFHDHAVAGPGSVVAGTSTMGWSGVEIISSATEVGVLEHIGASTFPYGLQPSTWNAADWAAIPANARNLDGALQLLEFIVRPETQQWFNYEFGAVPYYASAARWDWVMEQPLVMRFMESIAYGVGNPAHERWFDIRAILIETVERAHRREQPPSSLLAQAHQRLNVLLAE